jgi:thiamine biosynthesis protein ThiI
VIDKATDKLVLRPLITEHKQDIIRTAVEIGTAEFAENMPEYCGVISVNPKTKAKLGRVVHEETRLDPSILQRAIERTSMVTMDKVLNELGKDLQVEHLNQALPGQIVIDIRHPDQAEEQPLILDGIEQLTVPFYAINSRFKEFDPNRQYLLYCDQGMMSKLHAHHLLHEGYANVRVYRPDPVQRPRASSHA